MATTTIEGNFVVSKHAVGCNTYDPAFPVRVWLKDYKSGIELQLNLDIVDADILGRQLVAVVEELKTKKARANGD